MRPARSTTAGTIFVQDKEYREQRRHESAHSLGFLGVAAADQYHMGLPDGRLQLGAYVTQIATTASLIARRDAIDAIVTFGEHGYCGHGDHVAAHRAALLAQRILNIHRYRLPLFLLNQHGEGEARVHVDESQKLGALAFHRTQMHFVEDNTGTPQPEPDFFAKLHKTYGPLFTSETYDITLRPNSSQLYGYAA
ncbi:MAG: PIG-L family deacetylase [Candidatus Saccharimonadales bacterium]